jgi:hypothetical protein
MRTSSRRTSTAWVARKIGPNIGLTKHWSADCWILQCCVDKKGLEFCSDCDEFPCEKLVEWSKGCEGYGKALERLKEMRKG